MRALVRGAAEVDGAAVTMRALGAAPAARAEPAAGKHVAPRKILLVVNVDWFFWSHRLPIARALRDEGHTVVVAAGSEDEDYAPRIEAEGLRFVRLRMRRGSRTLGGEAATLRELVGLYRRERPEVVHHVTIKPVLYGSVAARVAGVPRIVNALSGLGWVSAATSVAGRSRCEAALLAYRAALASPRAWAIFQNPDDLALFVARRIVAPERAMLIRGSGVDARAFAKAPQPSGVPVVLFASRLLWDKGLGELIEAAARLRAEGRSFRLVLAGRVDRENPRGVPEETVRRWVARGLCEWRGHVADVAALLREASVVALPSYREGLPKVLLEAAASERAIVASDVPGCREIARDGVNAAVVPARDAGALARAIGRLLDDPAARARLGRRGREIAVREFEESLVVAQTLAAYRRVLE
jgi:glycosyltransferase involved in cell wall biosynthesis